MEELAKEFKVANKFCYLHSSFQSKYFEVSHELKNFLILNVGLFFFFSLYKYVII